MPSQKYAPLDGSPRGNRATLQNWTARRWHRALIRLGCFSFLSLLYLAFGPLSEEPSRLQCRHKLGPRKVHIVLPASQSSPRFCRSLSTLLIHDYQSVIVNWKGESHHSSKIFKLLEYLEKNTSAIHETTLDLPPQCADMRADIVISMDAYDVFTQRPLQVVLDQLDKIPERIIYSAEKGCHPPGESWCSQVPDSPLPHNFYGPGTDAGNLRLARARFLNSGVVVGYAKDLLHLYTDAAAQAKARQGQFHADQSIFGPLFTSKAYDMTLDYLGEMSSPYFFFEDEIGLQPTQFSFTPRQPYHQSQRNSFLREEVPWNFFNRVTGQFPTFVHFNDADKGQMDREWQKTWWGGGQGRPVMDRINDHLSKHVSITLESGDSIAFRDLCPGAWQDV